MPTLPKHTPEPWQQHDDHPMYGPGYADAVWTSKGPGYGKVCRCAPYTTATPESAANARRIVACVNACEGIADPAAALAEVREILTALLPKVEDDASRPGDRWAPLSVRRALALLGDGAATP